MAKRPPGPAPDERSCANCDLWAEQSEPADESRWGECRPGPPVVVVVSDEAVSQTPVTFLPYWCGAFKRRTQ